MLKTVRAADLPEAVRAVAAGRRLLDPRHGASGDGPGRLGVG